VTQKSDALPDTLLTWDASELRAVLSELEKAAWARSWSRLKRARENVYQMTSVDLRDTLRKELEQERDVS
jgi:hypothetical protein